MTTTAQDIRDYAAANGGEFPSEPEFKEMVLKVLETLEQRIAEVEGK